MPAIALNETHDPAAESWIVSANDPATDFPIQNLPCGSFTRGGPGQNRIGIAIGDQIFDLHAAADQRVLSIAPEVRDACLAPRLNPLMALGAEHWSALRKEIFGLLKSGDGQDQRKRAVSPCLLPIKDAAMQLPYDIGDFSDFYASIYHATNAGSMLRPQNPLLPNYKFVPVAYHGRSSSFIVSGSPVTRPCGQRRLDHDAPEFGASQQLDYEAEVAFVVGTGNALGHPISIGEAASHLFGLGLLNDWSARDIQAWEYQPLGPFLAKSFACTLSPWVVTMEALAPFRVKAATRPAGDPAPLKYLTSPDQNEAAAFDLGVEVLISSKAMRERGLAPHRISLSNLRHMYWTAAQLLTHQSSNGCNLRPGDILGSGTVSGPDKGSYSCLLEVTWRGANPLELPSGETRKFLEDGDEVIIRGRCEKDGFASIGLGECRSIILPSHASA